MQLARYLERGSLMWKMFLHVNQNLMMMVMTFCLCLEKDLDSAEISILILPEHKERCIKCIFTPELNFQNSTETPFSGFALA